MTNRIKTLQNLLALTELDGVVVNPSASLLFLTGLEFHLMERPVVLFVPKEGKPILILPELELAKLAGRIEIFKIHSFGDDPSSWQAVFEKALESYAEKELRIGLEATSLRFLELNFLQNALLAAIFVDASNLFAELRLTKDENDLAKMRKAAEIAEEALIETLKTVKVGQTEKEIANELLVQLYRHGSDAELPFMPIVSSGLNTANPHATPSERKLEENDILLFDWGAGFEGYFSDITRTFFIGNPTEEMQALAETVQRANHYATAQGKAGMTAGEIDKIARDEIEESGYGAYFTHRTGHGLGMEAHEAPFIFAGNPQILKEGMVFTIEPGIYHPEIGGVRIEDDVVVTSEGLISLSTLPREVMTITRYLELLGYFRG